MIYSRRFRFLVLCPLAVFSAAAACAQLQKPAPPPQPTLAASPTPAASLEVGIIFTGRLLGYLGLPEWQKPGVQTCPRPLPSSPEERFLNEATRLSLPDPNAPPPPSSSLTLIPHLLLGAGDNFAPAINARWLDASHQPDRRSKDANTWDWITDHGKWQFNWDDVDPGVQAAIEAGLGHIASDNVGCFLKVAKYDAVVPGEHDFYFGAERLRYLARFLATPGAGGNSHVVQMLAANLVIETSFAKSRKRLPDSDRDLSFVTKYPGLKFKTLSDGKSVLPWLQHFDFTAEASAKKAGPPSAKGQPWQPKFRLCRAERGDPSTIDDCPDSLEFECRNPKNETEKVACPSQLPVPDDVDFTVLMPGLDALIPDSNYAICVPGLPGLKPSQQLHGLCLRFSVHVPFFLYPNTRPQRLSAGQAYADPEPYLLKSASQDEKDQSVDEKDKWKGPEVAVFGVVDAGLRTFIGEVNDSWKNNNSKYKTEVLVLDPAEALYQQLQYFERKYQQDTGQKFNGIKVLLAQMAPPLARQLAAKLQGRFNVVISEADTEQVTPNGTVEVKPMPDDSSGEGTVNKTPTFVAVPPSYIDRTGPDTKGPVLQIRRLVVSHQGADNVWQFSISGRRTVLQPRLAQIGTLPINTIASVVELAIKNKVEPDLALKLPTNLQGDSLNKDLEKLALLALKRKFHADVALMQERDFYFEAPPDQVTSLSPDEALERILWKGDVAVLIMVKGSTLVEVLKESEQFDKQDNQTLSLELLKQRGLLTLGLFHDPLRDEYLVNGEVLDPNRLYSVATTDYIGLGDTGYPEIIEPGFDNPQVVGDFPKQLSRISSLVCREIGAANCQAAINASDLDELATTPLDRGPALTAWRQFENWTHIPYFLHPGRRPPESRKQMSLTPVELSVQDRRVWFLSHSSGASLTAVDNNLSEAQRKADFSAISSPSQLQAKQSHELIFTLKDTAGYRGRRVDGYLQPELNYDTVVTGQSVPPAVSNLKQNLLAGELGFFLHKSRDYPRVGLVFSARDESQVVQPVETVTLADPQRSTLNFAHERTSWLFGHFGFRAQDRHSYFEGGYEVGDARRVTAFNFVGPAGSQSCPFAASTSAQDEPACVTAHSSGASPTITKQSTPSATIGSAFRYGWYSTMQLKVPLHARLSYIFTNQFDYFYAGNNSISTDMLYRDLWSNSLSLAITPNFSIAPKFDVFFYENQVEHNFFRQVQSSIALKYAFDWFSGSRWKTALRYTEPKPQ